MNTLVDSPATNVIQMQPRMRSVVELDRTAAVNTPGALADVELDRWANRLARILLGRGAEGNTRIAVAIAPEVEAVVAAAAVRKIGATPAALSDADAAAPGAVLGITTKERRPELADGIDWLILDDRSTLQRYLVSSDAPISAAERRTARKSA